MKKLASILALSLLSFTVFAQTDPPFRKEIDAFKKNDKEQMPEVNQILFVGSSSFTKWKDVQDYFPGYPILNRGFGGSTLQDLIRYANEVIIPYHPKQILIYCGENDVASSDTVSARTVLARLQTLLAIIRKQLPATPIVFLSLKPSPSRWKFEPVIVESNRIIRNYIQGRPNIRFVNIHNAMLNADGSVMTDIFLGDNLHMNAKGYAIWRKILLPVLRK